MANRFNFFVMGFLLSAVETSLLKSTLCTLNNYPRSKVKRNGLETLNGKGRVFVCKYVSSTQLLFLND